MTLAAPRASLRSLINYRKLALPKFTRPGLLVVCFVAVSVRISVTFAVQPPPSSLAFQLAQEGGGGGGGEGGGGGGGEGGGGGGEGGGGGGGEGGGGGGGEGGGGGGEGGGSSGGEGGGSSGGGGGGGGDTPPAGSLPGEHLEQDPNNPGHYSSVPDGSHLENQDGQTVTAKDGSPAPSGGNPDLPISAEPAGTPPATPSGAGAPPPAPSNAPEPPEATPSNPTSPPEHEPHAPTPIPAPKPPIPSVPPVPSPAGQQPVLPTTPTKPAPPTKPGGTSPTGVPQGDHPLSPGSARVGPRSPTITTMEAAEQFVKGSNGKNCGPNGQCASLVKALVPGIPRHTTQWQRGIHVRGSDIPIGTPIATFNSYGQKGTNGYGPPDSPQGKSGQSHSGVYLGQNARGLIILHQFESSGGPRIDTIPWEKWNGSPKESGDKYYTIK
jgi:hypothetical protein